MKASNSQAQIFERYLNNACSPQEIKELLHYFDLDENEEELRKLIAEELASESEQPVPENLLQESFDKIRKHITSTGNSKTPVKHLFKRRWFNLSVAAVFLIAIATTTLFFLQQNHPQQPLVSQQQIVPGHDNAILTLADGSVVVLDSAVNGTLAKQSGVNVLKLNGQILYHDSAAKDFAATTLYNQISTARGNQYQLILADGSSVWLNASSSIRFPVTFDANERRVEVTGEAYFEVARNPSKPFRVLVHSINGNSEVEVLGTHFNVNAYDDEATVKTTLLEGAVRVNKGNEATVLKPGQQANMNNDGFFTVKNDVDVDEVVAWKNGSFVFNRQDIKSVMRQIARWYDVDIVYENEPSKETFSGIVSRKSDLSQVLKIMEKNGVHFNIEEHKIIVKP